jgi:hypothetical protein
MPKKLPLTAAAIAAIISTTQANAQGSRTGGRELGYFLPRTRAIARVDQLIRHCPTVVDPELAVTTTIALTDLAGPDPARFIRIDARSGFLSGRTTKLALRPDGTLTSFNASTKGEGGEILSGLIGLATTAASLAVGVPMPGPSGFAEGGRPAAPRLPFACTGRVATQVARLETVEQELADLRARVAEGDETVAAHVLDDLTAESERLVDQLTLSTDAKVFTPAQADFATGLGQDPPEMIKLLDPIDYTPWFGQNGDSLRSKLQNLGVPGRYGFRASLAPNRALFDALSAGDGSPDPGRAATPYLYYRRPVPASLSVAPCLDNPGGGQCAPDERDEAAAGSARKSVLFPQLSGLFSIRIGRGSLFGTRQASATFDEQGAPLALEYGSTPGGAEIAGVIGSADTAIATLRDSRTGAITRRLEREKALRELNDLLANDATDASP